MIIAVTGTHAVGKTTLTNFIQTKTGLPVIGEQARELLTTKYKFSEVDQDIAVFKKFQSDILDAQIALEKEYRSRQEGFIVDRTPLDSLTYVRERLTFDRDVDTAFFAKYRSKVYNFMLRYPYDRVYFIRYDPIFHEDDGQRNVNSFLMETIDLILDSELRARPRIPVLEIKSTSLEFRQKIVAEDLLTLGELS